MGVFYVHRHNGGKKPMTIWRLLKTFPSAIHNRSTSVAFSYKKACFLVPQTWHKTGYSDAKFASNQGFWMGRSGKEKVYSRKLHKQHPRKAEEWGNISVSECQQPDTCTEWKLIAHVCNMLQVGKSKECDLCHNVASVFCFLHVIITIKGHIIILFHRFDSIWSSLKYNFRCA